MQLTNASSFYGPASFFDPIPELLSKDFQLFFRIEQHLFSLFPLEFPLTKVLSLAAPAAQRLGLLAIEVDAADVSTC